MSAPVDELQGSGVPFTVDHNVSIVRRVSNTAIVNPEFGKVELGHPKNK